MSSSPATGLVYQVRAVAEVQRLEGCAQVTFRDGSAACIDAGHPDFDVLLINAESALRPQARVGVVLGAGGRTVDLNAAHETGVRSVGEDVADRSRLAVTFWGYSPICYLTRDHPDFTRIRSTLEAAVGTEKRVWVANCSRMVESEAGIDGEGERWWKIMDVRPLELREAAAPAGNDGFPNGHAHGGGG
jgi:hypothetical protein